MTSSPLIGTASLPPDKSISHRALLFGLIGDGPARLADLSPGDDVRATAAACRALGATIEQRGDLTVVQPPDRLCTPTAPLDCGNSGTSIRLLMGVLAPSAVDATLVGDASLTARPMGRVAEPLRRMGAAITGAADGTRAPLTVRGRTLTYASHTLPIASAQVKSALLLAGRDCGVAVREPRRSRDHTERLLIALGARLSTRADGTLDLVGGDRLRAPTLRVPGDPSQAAFLLVAATLVPGSELRMLGVCVNPTRTGAIDALLAMGADIEVAPIDSEGPEPVADLVVRAAPLRGTRIDGSLALRSLDELPVLAVAAAFAEGTTIIADAAELRVKESDRIARVTRGLRSLHVDVVEQPDGWIVHGGRPRGPATVDATGDHRIAMAFAVARLRVEALEIEGADAVASSWPTFYADLAALSRRR